MGVTDLVAEMVGVGAAVILAVNDGVVDVEYVGEAVTEVDLLALLDAGAEAVALTLAVLLLLAVSDADAAALFDPVRDDVGVTVAVNEIVGVSDTVGDVLAMADATNKPIALSVCAVHPPSTPSQSGPATRFVMKYTDKASPGNLASAPYAETGPTPENQASSTGCRVGTCGPTAVRMQ